MLQKTDEFLPIEFTISEDLCHQAWTNRLTSMDGNNCGSPVRVPQEVMLPFTLIVSNPIVWSAAITAFPVSLGSLVMT